MKAENKVKSEEIELQSINGAIKEEKQTDKDEKEEVKYCCFFLRMIDTYDARFLITLGLSYSQIYYNLAMLQVSLLDLLKRNYKIEPSKAQGTLALILLPWGFKLLYGLCTDLIPLCGSRKKNYIIAGGILQAIVGVLMGLKIAKDEISYFMVGGGVLMLAFSLMDVTLDGLMVI